MSGFVTYQWQLLELIRGVHELPLVRPGSASVLTVLWGSVGHRVEAGQLPSDAGNAEQQPGPFDGGAAQGRASHPV